MDLRIRKTLSSIKSSYFLLARERGIDNISVKALCDTAMINKATFYSHYKGIYELNEEFETEAIDELLSAERVNLAATAAPGDMLKIIVSSFSNNEKVKLIIASSRSIVFMNKLFEKVEINVVKDHASLQERRGIEYILSFVYHGLAYVFYECIEKGQDPEVMTEVIGECIERILK